MANATKPPSRANLPEDPKVRKTYPIVTGVLDYFPDAIAEVSLVSFNGNQQHNPGQPLHWAREKSTDHEDCIGRHTLQRGTRDTDGMRHSAKRAWRALAALQLEIEAERNGDLPSQTTVPVAAEAPRPAQLDQGEAECDHRSPRKLGRSWFCERPKGHTGTHMAWQKHTSRGDRETKLYEGGEWK